MPSLNIPVSQPQEASPPQVQGASGSAQPGQQSQGGIPMAGAGQQQQMQPPSHHETVALLQHISAFDRHWRQILEDPEIGKQSVKGKIYDAMADLMGEEYATLPQTMTLLKGVPDSPLEQKQWLEENVAKDQQTRAAVLNHYAQSRDPQGPNPMGSFEQESAAAQEPPADRASLVNGVVARYKKFPKKPMGVKGIPLRARSQS